ncbi:MAG: S-layer homology domain-containing protein [Peptococcaceae bacterium]|nr:S-layer homology domain-containing protein [Peptococcaceae bacterium]
MQFHSAGGEFRGNVFYPRQGGTATLEASAGSARGSLTVRVVGPEALVQMIVSPAAATLTCGQTAGFTVKIKTRDGETFDVDPGNVSWSVKGEAGTVLNGKFTAGSVPGAGEIVASFGGLTVPVPVTVLPPPKEAGLAPDKPAAVDLGGGVGLYFPAGSVTKPAAVKVSVTVQYAPLPAGFDAVEVYLLEPAAGGSLELAAPFTLTWKPAAASDGRLAVLAWNEKAASWRVLPSQVDSAGGTVLLRAKPWGLGKLAIVTDSRTPPSFKDTESHWARRPIADLAACGVVSGFPGGNFAPGQPVTRAQFAVLLAGALQWPKPGQGPSFKDVIPGWAGDAVAAAAARGIIKGYPDGKFAPDATITRGEMAVIIARALSLPAGDGDPDYSDASVIPEYAKKSVLAVTKAGLMQGENGLFRPGDGASRAEAAAVVDRLLTWWLGK